ncbi:MAG: hypothetical protein E7Z92_04615 [Cyanobacteria bacterium SIG31]|nr:hypothetical protein [Cyanobacteria bacterium SIG31]
MSYSYSTPVSYGPQPQLGYEINEKKKNNSSAALIGGVAVGGIGGAVIGSKVNLFSTKNGELKKEVVNKIFNNYIKSAEESFANAYNQSTKIIQDLKNVLNVEELNTLKNNYTEFFNNLKLNTENINADNLKENLNTIKQRVESDIATLKQEFKNKIQPYWNKDKKVFENINTSSDDICNAINKSIKGARLKTTAKYAGIAAAVLGVTAFVAHKVSSYIKPLYKE